MKKATRRILFIFLLGLIFYPQNVLAVPFTATFNWSDSFRVYGYQPIPQVNGFDYYFSPELVNASLAGRTVNIHSVEVSGYGDNLGQVINFDWEVHLSASDINLPEGQFTQTHIDPLSGYTRTAEAQYRFVIGSRYDQNDYIFGGSYDFLSNSASAYPYLASIKQASTQEMILTNGLHAQVFLWTGDNRNCQIQFENLSLTVKGESSAEPIPEPATMLLLSTGLIGLVGFKRFTKKS